MKIFKKGQKVTRRKYSNASNFNRGELDILGASAACYNEETVFEIEGTVKLITSDLNKEVYGAYLLSKDGVNIGYVYNTYLNKVEELRPDELLIKYKSMLTLIRSEICEYEYACNETLKLYIRANTLEMIINDLKVK